MIHFIRNLSELDNKVPMIDSVWLKNELDIIRHCGISRQGFTDARTYAQVRKHVSALTVNEAVRLAFIALYSPNKKPLIKKLIQGPTLTKMDPLDLNNQINQLNFYLSPTEKKFLHNQEQHFKAY